MTRRTFKKVDTTLPTIEQLKELQQYQRAPNNRRILKGLFVEYYEPNDQFVPIFTIKPNNVEIDDHLYYSLRAIYFSYDHVPGYEYEFAMDVFGNWDHWKLLCDSTVKADIEEWREELTIKLQSKALGSLFKTALFEGSKGTPAARYLADRGWEVKRGRPSKDEVEREKKIAAGVRDNLEDDMARLGLKVVK